MSDKPKIEVGQRWVTGRNTTVRILATDGYGAFPVIGEDSEGVVGRWLLDGRWVTAETSDPNDLISLAPQTVKREVALYRNGSFERVEFTADPELAAFRRVSEPLTIEFTLLPGRAQMLEALFACWLLACLGWVAEL